MHFIFISPAPLLLLSDRFTSVDRFELQSHPNLTLPYFSQFICALSDVCAISLTELHFIFLFRGCSLSAVSPYYRPEITVVDIELLSELHPNLTLQCL